MNKVNIRIAVTCLLALCLLFEIFQLRTEAAARKLKFQSADKVNTPVAVKKTGKYIIPVACDKKADGNIWCFTASESGTYRITCNALHETKKSGNSSVAITASLAIGTSTVKTNGVFEVNCEDLEQFTTKSFDPSTVKVTKDIYLQKGITVYVQATASTLMGDHPCLCYYTATIKRV